MQFKNLAAASVITLASFSVTPIASAQEHTTQLSQCTRNGLVGAGVGGLLGALVSRRHRAQHAVIGAAVGGVGTWGVCHLLTQREEQRVESGYQSSLNSGHPYTQSWQSNAGTRSLYVDHPQSASSAGPGCRTVTGHINDPQNGRQDLPPETYCRNSSGQWTPA